jgi:hypothetical protein
VSATLDLTDGGTLTALLDAPPTVTLGQWFSVTLTVTNGGTLAVADVSPVVSASSGAVRVGGPVPASVALLSPGDSVSFVWTFSAAGVGLVTFSATASGTDGALCAPLAGAGSAASVVPPPAFPFLMTLAPAVPAASLSLGEIFTVTLTVSNAGGAPATGVVPLLVPVGTATLMPVTGPLPAAGGTLAPQESLTYTWTFRVTRGGTVTFEGAATGDPGVSSAPPVEGGAPFPVREAGDSLDATDVYPSPFSPAGGRRLKFRRMVPFATVRIYTIEGDEVARAEADGDGRAEWDGRNRAGDRVAPGVYLYLLSAPDGRTKTGKFRVAR